MSCNSDMKMDPNCIQVDKDNEMKEVVQFVC